MTATYNRPDRDTQSAAQFKAFIDGGFEVFERMLAAFAAHEQSAGSPSPDMTVVVDAGFVWDGTELAEKAQQTVTGFTTPAAGFHRIDRVVYDKVTGDARRIEGTPAAGSPSAVAPAIPVGSRPICQVLITSDDTAITDSMITDERTFPG